MLRDLNAEEDELERLAKDNLGELCNFPSENEDDDLPSLNASQL